MTATTTIEHVVEIDASPSTVYAMWTTADGLRAWWGVDAAVDARPGGAISVDIDGEHVMLGEFVELDEPDRIVFTFGWKGATPAPGSTTVEVRIDANGAGSRLTLRHAGLPIELIETHARGWTHYLGERLSDAGATP